MAKRVLSGSLHDDILGSDGKRTRGEGGSVPPVWTLTDANGYMEDGISYEVNRNIPAGVIPAQIGAPATMKSHLNAIFKDIFEEWPIAPSADKLQQYSYYCTNKSGFQPLFLHMLDRHIRVFENQRGEEAQHLKSFKANISTYLDDIFSRFLSYNLKMENPSIKECFEKGRSYRNTLQQIERQGKTCRNRAVWVGLERMAPLDHVKFHQKRLVETAELVAAGSESGVLQNNHILLENQVNRICAPKDGNEKETRCIILWTKESVDDHTPSPEKIFGAIIYGLPTLSQQFSSENQYTNLDYNSTLQLAQEKSSVDRSRVLSDGKMAKTTGAQSVFGKPYEVKMVYDTLPVGEDVIDNENLRLQLLGIEEFIESRHHAFLLGFLPEFAYKRYLAAKESGLLNSLGYPKVSNFGTFGYSASSHVDNDDSPSMGWVLKRPLNLHRNSSNFVWVSHRLVVEMAEDMFWFWDAAVDHHGTTVSLEALTNPQKVTSAFMKNNPDSAQWTRASVLPKAVAQAYQKEGSAGMEVEIV